MASKARSVLPTYLLFRALRQFIKPTVNADELPMPLLDGKSPVYDISKGFPPA